MRFLSAYQLWLLLLLPLLVIGYLWLQAKRKRIVLGYSNPGLVRQALADTSTSRRHIPPTILLMAVASMIIAGARPIMDVVLPTARKTIVSPWTCLTGAAYYRASDQMELSAAYEALTHELVMEKAEREVSGLFANIATVLTLLAAALSIAWFGRVA